MIKIISASWAIPTIPGAVYLFFDLNVKLDLCFLYGKDCTGGWLLLTRQGLSPCKKHQALPGAHVGDLLTYLVI